MPGLIERMQRRADRDKVEVLQFWQENKKHLEKAAIRHSGKKENDPDDILKIMAARNPWRASLLLEALSWLRKLCDELGIRYEAVDWWNLKK